MAKDSEPRPLWDEGVRLPELRELDEDLSCDAVVIGAGIAGLSTAYHLAREGQRVVVIEAALIGAVSQAIGLVVGLALSVVLVYVINVQSFGWTIQFHVPTLFLVQVSVAVIVATAVAGIYPARRAARASAPSAWAAPMRTSSSKKRRWPRPPSRSPARS